MNKPLIRKPTFDEVILLNLQYEGAKSAELAYSWEFLRFSQKLKRADIR